MLVRVLFACAASLAFVSGCVSAYSPPAVVAPLLDEKGDVAVGGMLRAFQPDTAGTAYIAAAPTTALRVYVSGSFERLHRGPVNDPFQRSVKLRNDTQQAEAGIGWGTARKGLLTEVLGGAGGGRTRSVECRGRQGGINSEYYHYCNLLIDARTSFARFFAQTDVGLRRGPWVGALGLRLAVTRYDYDRLFGAASSRIALVPTAEPFITQRIGFPWGKLELQAQLPVVLDTPRVTRHETRRETQVSESAKLVSQTSPRMMLGFQLNLDEFFRVRSAKQAQ